MAGTLIIVTTAMLSQPRKGCSYAAFLTPAPLADGREPESRVVYSGISWDNYLAFDKALGGDRPGPRFYYLDGELEVMSTSDEHERIKKWLGGCMEDYFLEAGLETRPHGQATMRSALEQAGAEPDESWCFGENKEFPDLILEIALTSGGVRKLELYQRFRVREVWFWRNGRLELFALRTDGGGYEALETGSRLFARTGHRAAGALRSNSVVAGSAAGVPGGARPWRGLSAAAESPLIVGACRTGRGDGQRVEAKERAVCDRR